MTTIINTDARYSTINNLEGDQHIHFNSASQTLLKLRHTSMDASLRSECLPGTRGDLREKIGRWVFEGEERVFWLYGFAGSGKSTISTTIANFFRDQERLGAFIFCNRDVTEMSDPSNIIRNIAYRLALFDTRIHDEIVTAIDILPSIAESPLRLQFNKLLVEPLLKLRDTEEAPIVIVLDALDECGNAESRVILLALLAEESVHLPSFIRFLITSRAVDDIRIAFATQPHVVAHEIDIYSENNSNDVLSFLRFQMAAIRANPDNSLLGLAPDWPGDTAIQALAERAGGLFIWASTACLFIRAYKPLKRLDMLLGGDVNAKPGPALDDLYKTALEAIGILDDEEICSDFRAIMGIILVARNPISYQTIDTFLSLDSLSSSLSMIKKLACVLHWSDAKPTEPVRILHPSFADFLMKWLHCDHKFYIDNTLHNSNLAISCVHHLNQVLKKNISNLALSTEPVEVTLPDPTSYASICWIDHVCVSTSVPDALPDTLEQFLFQHLLHWLEVMSIMKQSRMVIALVNRFLHWLRMHLSHRRRMIELISDVNRFVQSFASSIEEHPLLIYLSALPFTPVDTLLFKTFADQSTPQIVGGYDKYWPPLLQTLTGHKDKVHALAFSQDGERIASASFDLTIRVWHVSSGASLLAPLTGHTNHIYSVAFSADGRKIVSGSRDCTVRVWDAVKGIKILPTLAGHTERVFTAAFSPDGSRIASGSADHTILVWDASTGTNLFGPLRGHEGHVFRVTFTPDGQRILSGGKDNTVCGWDVMTGMMTLVLPGHDDSIRAISVSSNGRFIFSASYDGTIRIWDATTGQEHITIGRSGADAIEDMVVLPGNTRIASLQNNKVKFWDVETGTQTSISTKLQPTQSMAMSPAGDRFAFVHADTIGIYDASSLEDSFPLTQGDGGDIRALAFSPDGHRFASISCGDSRVRLWDARTGQEASPPLKGHNDDIDSVAFSPDGKFIASGSADSSIIVWDALLGLKVLPLHGHEQTVVSVVFSSDGMQVLSGSSDCTIRLWSLRTCAETHPPMRSRTEIQSVTFHPDEQRVISGCLQGTVSCWDIQSGAQMFRVELVTIPDVLTSVRFSPKGQLMITCHLFNGHAPRVVIFPFFDFHETKNIMPIVVTSDGWIHDFRTRSVIGKLPSIVSIPVYSSTLSAIAFAPRDRMSTASIMHFPPSELTMPGTSQLADQI